MLVQSQPNLGIRSKDQDNLSLASDITLAGLGNTSEMVRNPIFGFFVGGLLIVAATLLLSGSDR